jgi:PTS system mannose-specific IID component
LEITWLQALLIAVAAYLAMSVWPLGVGYFTLYRPLLGGTIVGLILGDVQQGMAFGAALNAIYLGFISTGGTLPGDLVTAGYVGTALALASRLDVEAAIAAFGVPLGVLGGFLWFARMTLGSVLVHWADERAKLGDARGVAAINLWGGQGLLLALYGAPSFVAVYYGQAGIEHILELVPVRLITALSVVGGILPALGIGILLRSIGRARLIPYFIVGFVLSVYLDLPILVIALLGVVAAWWVMDGQDMDASLPDTSGDVHAHRVPKGVLWGAWARWVMFLHASYNYERLQGLGFAHTMKPVIEYLYETPGERAAALERHTVFFNSEPQLGALVPAAVIAMEEERASGTVISDEAINSVKSGLMGPLAGVGDSIIQGLVTPLLLSLGISLAQQGSLLGPILYSVLISMVILGSVHLFWSLGYRWGREAVSLVLSSGWVRLLSEGAAIVGMMVLGGLMPTVVQFSLAVSIRVGSTVVSLQNDVFDGILRGLLPLTLTLFVWWLLHKRVKSILVVVLLFAIGVDLTYLGIAGDRELALFAPEWTEYVLGGRSTAMAAALVHLGPPLVVTCVAILVLVLGHGSQKRKEKD